MSVLVTYETHRIHKDSGSVVMNSTPDYLENFVESVKNDSL